MKAVSELQRDLESALKAQAALQLAKEGAERELASVRSELAALQKKQQTTVQDTAFVSRELSPQQAGPVSATSQADVMPELAAAKAAAAEAIKQVEVLEGRLASAQVRIYASLPVFSFNVAKSFRYSVFCTNAGTAFLSCCIDLSKSPWCTMMCMNASQYEFR